MPGKVISGPIQIHFKNDQGQDTTAGLKELTDSLQQGGTNIVNMSPDGMTLTMQDEQGNYEMDVPDVLKNLGYTDAHITPTSQDDSRVNVGYRAAISRLPDDDAKKAYLESKLRKSGVENPKVVGQGRNFFYYEPGDNKWYSLTNSKNWDTADLVEGAMEAGSGLAAGAGAVAGGLMGNIPGAMAGAGAGSALAEGGMRAGLDYLDPDYAAAYPASAQVKDTAVQAGINSALGAVPGGLGKLGKALGIGSEEGLGALARTGPISTAARAVGKVGEAGGWLMDKAGGLIKKAIPKEALKMFTPGLSQAQMAQGIAELPEYAITGGAKGANYLAQGAKGLEDTGLQKAGTWKGISDEYGNLVFNPADRPSTALGKLAQGTEEVLTQKPQQSAIGSLEARNESLNKIARGIKDPDSLKASDIAQNVATKVTKAINPNISEEGLAQAQQVGKTIGKGAESLGSVGRAIGGAADTAINATGAGMQGVGKASQFGGKTLYNVGTATQPYEYHGLANLAAEKKIMPGIQNLIDQKEKKKIKQQLDSKNNPPSI